MLVHVLACDYDGTIADGGRVTEATAATLARVRGSGRKLILVTGRMLPDLRRVCPDMDTMFDAIVAENGGVLYQPAHRETKILGDRPEPVLTAILERQHVPFEIGDSIIATGEEYAEVAVAAIREAGVERSLVFNKGSLMLLPGGVTKGTGLEAILAAFELSPHNTIGIGDGENDHAFLSLCECAVAVADAVPALRDRADVIAPAPGARGATVFVEQHVLEDLRRIAPTLTRHDLVIGDVEGATSVRIPVFGTRLLIVGPSSSGKSTFAGVLIERLVESGRSFSLIDPEGDYQALADLQGVVVLGGKSHTALPKADDLKQLVRRPKSGLVLDLSAMTRAEKVAYATQALGTIAIARSASGMPHWLIIDEAHHLFPTEGSSAAELLGPGTEPFCLITLEASDLAPKVAALPNIIAATDLGALDRAVRAVQPAAPARRDVPLERGEAAVARIDGDRTPTITRLKVQRPRRELRRHVRKYAEGELPPERSFYFRGPDGALNLRAANLIRFGELAEGVGEPTWAHHLRRGDYSAWIREAIKDQELADEVARIESNPDVRAAESRHRVLDAIKRRYAV